jgi:alpha-D-ribose 1-methylphosphonate 5-triphosphate diphosphatase
VPQDLLLTQARLVLADRVVAGTLRVSDGVIDAIDEAPTVAPGAEDLGGDLLLPGLVELHTDNLERHLLPRPGVHWPAFPALMAHDAQAVAAGMTTVFDALCVGHGSRRDWQQVLSEAVPVLQQATDGSHLRAQHLLHLRCELIDPDLPDLFDQHGGHPLVRLVSVMDHTPGQRQFADVEQYRKFMRGLGLGEAELDQSIDRFQDLQHRFADRHRAHLAERCAALGIPLASHDDETDAHVAEAAKLGARLSEFPTTATAAAAARQHGLKSVLGAPNVVRGGSHTGNVSALDLARRGLLDILSSDYVPSSLLHACFRLTGEAGIALPQAITMVTRTPAEAVGLTDRGEIALGRRADLVRVADTPSGPVVRAVWREGARVF